MLAENLRSVAENLIADIAKGYFEQQGKNGLPIQIGPVYEGAFAFGAPVGDLFFKVGKPEFSPDFVGLDLQLSSRNLPHTVENYGVFRQNGLVYSVMEALPDNAIQLLSILKQYGLQTVQTGEQVEIETPINLKSIYEQIIDNLSDIHSQELNLSANEQEQALAQYHHHLINSPSRLQGIADLYFQNITGAVTQPQFQLLRKKMLALSALRESSSINRDRVRPVHGDSWAANTFYLAHKQQIRFIDPELALADPALDICFALADLAFSGDPQLINLAEQLLHYYKTSDPQICDNMAFPFGYKAWVSAVFDAQAQEQQLNRFYSAVGAIQQGLERQPFSFLKLNDYAQLGASQF